MDLLTEHFISLVSMGLLLLLSAFFSGTETALFSLTREQLKRLRTAGRNEERILALLSENPSGLLIAILFGNIVVNILFFSLSAVVSSQVEQHLGAWGEAAFGLAILLTVILAGEILPKAVGISFPDRVVRLGALPLRGWYALLGPVRRGLEAVTRLLEPRGADDHPLSADDLKLLIETTRHDPTFGIQEKAIVEDIVNLPEIRVRELMVPRVRQLFRRTDSQAGETLAAAAEQEIELIPVYEGEEDNVVGVVDACDLFAAAPDRPLRDFLQPVRFVPETKRADAMLREFLADNLRMVCVVDEFGGLAGTIALEDLLEEVVGEFDPAEEPTIEKLGDCTYRLPGNLGIREWRELFMGFLPDEFVRTLALDTLSGLVVSLLRRLPRPGDTVQVQNLKFTVEKVRSNRIESVLLELEGGCGQ